MFKYSPSSDSFCKNTQKGSCRDKVVVDVKLHVITFAKQKRVLLGEREFLERAQ